MVEVKNVVCRLRLPGICSCAPSGRIGATVTCQVGIPLSGLTIGASAHILPCGDPASFGYRAWAGNRVSRALFIIILLLLFIYCPIYYFFRAIFVVIQKRNRSWPIGNGRQHSARTCLYLPPPQVSALESPPSPPAPKFQELCAEVVSQQILRLASVANLCLSVRAATRIAHFPCPVHPCLSTSSLALTISAISADNCCSILHGSSECLLPLQTYLSRLVNKWACVTVDT